MFATGAPAQGRAERIRAFARRELTVTAHLLPWRNHMLRVLLPGQPFSVWLFWSPEWEFLSYYVNLETPFTRSAVGFDSSDHVLDICVRPDRSWYYKDQDELDAWVEHGLVNAEAAAEVRRDAAQAVELIEGWQMPFDAGLEDWRPDPAWAAPALPPRWEAHASDIQPWAQIPGSGPSRPVTRDQMGGDGGHGRG